MHVYIHIYVAMSILLSDLEKGTGVTNGSWWARPRPLWAPLGPNGPDPNGRDPLGPPWVLMGRALMGSPGP